MPYITAIIEILDSAGKRVDLPVSDGSQQPIVLKLDASLTSSSKDLGDGTTEVTIGAASQTGAYATEQALLDEIARAEAAEAALAPVARKPDQMGFSEVFNERSKAWFDGKTLAQLQPSALVWITDPFTDTTTTRFTQVTEDSAGTLSIGSGQATITLATGASRSLFIREGTALIIPQAMISVDLVSFAGTDGGHRNAVIGIIKDSSNYIVASYNTLNGASNVVLQCKIGGSSTFNAAVTHTMIAGSSLGLSIVGNSAVIYVKEAGVWTKLTSYDFTSKLNLEAQDCSLWFPCFGFTGDTSSSNTMVFDNYQVGRFGGTGARDFTLVTNADGSPYITGGNTAYLMATIVDALATGSHAVCTFDLDTKAITMTGIVMNNRSGAGTIYHDHSGHLVIDGANQRVMFTGWDGHAVDPRIWYAAVPVATKDLLASGAVYAASTASWTLSTVGSGGGNWDPFLIKVGGTWYLAYVASTSVANVFWPVLDSSADLSTWANVGADATALRYEGTKISVIGGVPYVLVGGQYGVKVYDLTMTAKGYLGGMSPGDGTTQPHPQLIPYGQQVLWVTFDQILYPAGTGVTFSWGCMRTLSSPRY
jgi:hypothetical protein